MMGLGDKKWIKKTKQTIKLLNKYEVLYLQELNSLSIQIVI